MKKEIIRREALKEINKGKTHKEVLDFLMRKYDYKCSKSTLKNWKRRLIQEEGWDLKDKTFAVEGFGNVGWFAAKFLTEHGAKMIAASDSKGAVYHPSGLDFKHASDTKKKTGTVTNCKGTCMHCEALLDVKADILITAAIPDLIKQKDVSRLKFKLIVEGSNIPASPDVEKQLARKRILVIPDIIANAGGVISSYVEYKGGSAKTMWKLVEKKISTNTALVLKTAKTKRITPRAAAIKIAKKRIQKK